MNVPPEQAEQARAVMLELFPEGFEEVEVGGGVELAAYTDAGGEERVWHMFGGARSVDVEDGWEVRWRDFHRPVRVGPLWIGPPWEHVPEGVTAVIVDPGRAFGTGGHATTRLCLELLLELRGGSLLDVGCGSGVLAVAAARLGFSPVVALDEDPAAVEATERGAALNQVEIDVRLADALRAELPRADVAVANLTLSMVEAVGPRLDCGLLVTSGYLDSERPNLPGLRATRRLAADGWAADLFERTGAGRRAREPGRVTRAP